MDETHRLVMNRDLNERAPRMSSPSPPLACTAPDREVIYKCGGGEGYERTWQSTRRDAEREANAKPRPPLARTAADGEVIEVSKDQPFDVGERYRACEATQREANPMSRAPPALP